MGPAQKRAFTIGVVAAAVGTGIYAVSQGWLQALVYLPPAKHITLFPNPTPDPSPSPSPSPKAQTQPAPEGKSGELSAIEPLAKPAPAAPASPKPAKGAFDVVRVEPSGELVVAGRCAPDCTVALTADGRTIETAKADAAGAWAMTPPALPPGDHQLGLTVTTPDGASSTSEQTVTVSVPTAPSKEVVVVLNEPNAPSKVLQRPGQSPASQPKPQGAIAAAPTPTAPARAEPAAERKPATVSIVAVDAEKGRLFIQGTAPAGGSLRVYLNDAPLAQPVAGDDERWSVRIEKGLAPGAYAARVDQVEKPSGKVIARAEARFTYEGEVAEAAPQPKPARPAAAADPKTAANAAPAAPRTPNDGVTTTFGQPPASAGAPAAETASPEPARTADPANPVVSAIDTAKVARGDSLWRISRKIYGKGMRYTVIFSANDQQIRDPDLIYPGQTLVLPTSAAEGSARQ